MALKAVLFDFDDTLIDVSASRQERAMRAHRRLREHGVEVGWSAFWHSINALDESGFYRRGMEPVIRDLGLHTTALGNECVDYWVFRGAEDLLALSPGCTDMLEVLSKRYRLGIVTNGPADSQHHKFEHTGLARYFELFLSSGEAGVHKPDPEIFRIALERLDVSPKEAVFIGDHLDLDVIGAQRAGMKAIWYSGAGKRPDDPFIVPDATIRRLEELPAALERLN
jgi:2-haloalkanoic acid dehalogenase type II